MTSTSGNMEGALGELLKGFGITSAENNDGVRNLVIQELERCNLKAEMLSLRYGKLTLSASPLDAQMLTFEKDNLLKSLQSTYPDEVSSIVIRVKR